MNKLFILAALLLCGSVEAQVTVAPTRLVFENRVRSAEVSLINVSNETQTYRVSLTHLQMFPDGSMKEITEPQEGAPWADFIRFSPREVILEPKVVQTCRVQVRLPADLPTGEYRSALMFRQIPPTQKIDKPDTEPTEISIKITVIPGISIPIIVRHSTQSSTASLVCSLADSMGALECKLERAGQESIYGNLSVNYFPLSAKKPLVIGGINGLAIYAENNYRTIKVPLTLPPNTVLSKGLIQVEFVSNPHNKSLANTSVNVP